MLFFFLCVCVCTHDSYSTCNLSHVMQDINWSQFPLPTSLSYFSLTFLYVKMNRKQPTCWTSCTFFFFFFLFSGVDCEDIYKHLFNTAVCLLNLQERYWLVYEQKTYHSSMKNESLGKARHVMFFYYIFYWESLIVKYNTT